LVCVDGFTIIDFWEKLLDYIEITKIIVSYIIVKPFFKAHMFTEEKTGFKYYLLFVDVFSSKVITVPLKTREKFEVISALKKILREFKYPIYEIQADRESSFLSRECKKFLRDSKILFKPKFGKNKAAIGCSFISRYCCIRILLI